MRTLKLTIAYDGTRYAGWQAQKRSRQSEVRSWQQKPTIQETLETVLQRILQEPVKVVASGRTDAGAHAEAQVAHLRMRSTIALKRLLRGVNALLPSDIAVTRIEEAARAFHARFDALKKRYRYRIFTGQVAPPFIRPYVHHVRVPLQVALMRREMKALKGRHDFRAFARLPGPPLSKAARHRLMAKAITAVQLARRGAELHLEIEGNGFLHTMVRSIAGTLIDIGRGRLPAGTVRRLLTTGQRRLVGTVAPARGLALLRVTYPPAGRRSANRWRDG